jgi:hypothetical protein
MSYFGCGSFSQEGSRHRSDHGQSRTRVARDSTAALANDLTYRFPLIVQTLARLRLRSCIIDGGAVACDDNGVALFNRVRYRHDDESIFLYAFDLIELNGDDLRPDPLERRKATRARPGQSSGSGKIVQLALRMFRQSQRARS